MCGSLNTNPTGLHARSCWPGPAHPAKPATRTKSQSVSSATPRSAASCSSVSRPWRADPPGYRATRCGATDLPGPPERGAKRRSLLSARLYPVKFFPQHGSYFLANFLGEARTLHVLSKSIVDQGLIIAAVRSTDQFAKVIDDVAVQAYCDPDLFRRQRNNRSSLAFAEIVFPLHIRLSSY